MVLEHAVIDVTPGREAEFEAAFASASANISGSPGCRAVRLRRCIETPARYLLLVEWERLEDHTETFRQSPSFQRWRQGVGELFAAAPAVEHYAEPA